MIFVKRMIALLLLYLLRFVFWLRYKVTIKGLDKLNPSILNKSGGVLFLPNHPAILVDPALVTLAIWKKYPVRPIIVDYMYNTPFIHTIMRFINALSIPNFSNGSNSLKKKRAEKVIDTIIEDLKKQDDFLIYPAGRTKQQAKEVIGGSAVHKIIQSVPNLNIVLVKTSGLWGSRFSRALTGGKHPPSMIETFFWGIKIVLKNLLFFTPRRRVTIEFSPAGPDFPFQASRVEMNRYLEKWYNRPDGISPQKGDEPGESLYLVPYSLWSSKLPEVKPFERADDEVDLSRIPKEIKDKILHQLSSMSRLPQNQIKPEMDLSGDLGLDSLDGAELLVFLEDQFEVAGIPVQELSSVGKVMALAAKQIDYGKEEKEEKVNNLSKWLEPRPHQTASLAKGETIPEVFLNNCNRMKRKAACSDHSAGIVTYSQAKLRMLLLAEHIRKLPGDNIGILLPSSVAAYITILACQLAGKIPVLINWTVGPQHLKSVVELSQVQAVLSSWAFLDRLENIDFNGIEDQMILLEEMKETFTYQDKFKAFLRSFYSTSSLLSLFGAAGKSGASQAVLLFTSGTESLPKGVPLSHANILSNQKDALEEVGLFQDDILVGMLPPFHAFGFTLSGLLCLLSGIRVVYSPDPTNGKGLARTIERWKATLVCGTPAFLKGILKQGTSDQLKTLRICVTGAEKAPEELFEKVAELKNCRLVEGYGITECSPVLTVNLSGNRQAGVGKPLPQVELCIVDLDKHQAVKAGAQGLILARGPNIFYGYLNKGIASPFLHLNGEEWYSTGDLGSLDSQGNLIISGRLKRFVKVGGEMISLGAIEEVLQKKMAKRVEEQEGPSLAVCAKEEAGEKTKMILFVRFSVTLEEVNLALKEAGFSNLARVYQVKQLSEIPLMGSGKINYRALNAELPALLEEAAAAKEISL